MKRTEKGLGSKKRAGFFPHWCLNLSVIFIKENLSHKIKKKQNNETEILDNEKRGTERD